jgi:hypothetical protein
MNDIEFIRSLINLIDQRNNRGAHLEPVVFDKDEEDTPS